MDDLEGYTRIIGIDPGSKTLGVAVLDYNVETGHLILVDAWTFNTNRAVYRDPERAERLGAMDLRLDAITQHLLHVFRMYGPDTIIAETAFSKRRMANAFQVLTRVWEAMRKAVQLYRTCMALIGIDPASAKKEVGVPGNSSDKDLMTRALMKMTNLDNRSGKPLKLMSEHTIDGIAIGHYYCATALGFKAAYT